MNNIFKYLVRNELKTLKKTSLLSRNLSSFIIKDVHEPKYLDYLKPQIPYYPLLNVQVSNHSIV